MREGRAVAEPHERVHDGRRLEHDLDPLVRQAEEEVRLEQLEPLVRERGGVDGDLRPHAPGRVGERLLGSHVLELVARAAPERPAGAGEDERVDLLRRAAFEALEGGRVLAVDGEKEPSSPLPRLERQLARRDEALLVRERQRHAALERPERRGQPGEADDRVEDDIWLRALQELREIAADLRQRSEAVDRLRAGRGGRELELRVVLDDLQGLASDRPRDAEHRNTLHLLSVRPNLFLGSREREDREI